MHTKWGLPSFLPAFLFYVCWSLKGFYLNSCTHTKKTTTTTKKRATQKPFELMETLVHKEELCVLSEALNWKDGQDS